MVTGLLLAVDYSLLLACIILILILVLVMYLNLWMQTFKSLLAGLVKGIFYL